MNARLFPAAAVDFEEWKLPLLEACPYKPGDYLSVQHVVLTSTGPTIWANCLPVLIINREVNAILRKVIFKIHFINFRSEFDEWILADSERINCRGQLHLSTKYTLDCIPMDFFDGSIDTKRIHEYMEKRKQHVNSLHHLLFEHFPPALYPIIVGYWQC